ncbi:MAG: hypothetical protein ABI054_03560 [Planctomycetota bacterium]
MLSSFLLILAAAQSVPEANAAFEKAEKDWREGRYWEAQSGYRRIAEKFAASATPADVRRSARRPAPSSPRPTSCAMVLRPIASTSC